MNRQLKVFFVAAVVMLVGSAAAVSVPDQSSSRYVVYHVGDQIGNSGWYFVSLKITDVGVPPLAYFSHTLNDSSVGYELDNSATLILLGTQQYLCNSYDLADQSVTMVRSS